MRRLLLVSLLLSALLITSAAAEPDEAHDDRTITTIAFGSCMKEQRKAFIFDDIAAENPMVFLWMGDNIYGDSDDPEVLAQKYTQLAEHEHYAPFSRTDSLLVFGVWDDHDYGKNDAGKEFIAKEGAQTAFLDFFGIGQDDPRRDREGVYSSIDLGPDGQRLRLIFLDARYHRDEIGSDGTILGDNQWDWLETQLDDDSVDLNIIVSGIQIIPAEHRFEKWANFPTERERLFALLDQATAPSLLLSGDRHLGEISRAQINPEGRTYTEITSSSLNLPFGGNKDEPNRARLGENVRVANYGLLEIDWSADTPNVTASIRTYDRDVMAETTITLPN